LQLIEYLTGRYKVVFPIHPRTVNNLKKFGLFDRLIKNNNLITSDPLDYFAFQKLVKHCKVILTDSGGIQEESTWLGVPCLTLRPSTERPVTSDVGTNTLLPFDLEEIRRYMSSIEQGTYKKGRQPELWDGHATERIFEVLSKFLA
jgi:UDP-N-acetylglucosamine 2-epimerase (non-hydrolysing)